MAKALPRGRSWFVDARLGELRSTESIGVSIDFSEIDSCAAVQIIDNLTARGQYEAAIAFEKPMVELGKV